MILYTSVRSAKISSIMSFSHTIVVPAHGLQFIAQICRRFSSEYVQLSCTKVSRFSLAYLKVQRNVDARKRALRKKVALQTIANCHS